MATQAQENELTIDSRTGDSSVRSPLLTLPGELLAMILHEANYSRRDWLNIRLICRQLTSFINETPSFWTSISNQYQEPATLQRLERSRQTKLDVWYTYPDHPDSDPDSDSEDEDGTAFYRAILPQAYRIKTLHCDVDIQKVRKKRVCDVAVLSSQSLEELDLTHPFTTEGQVVPLRGIPFDRMPCLRELGILGVLTTDSGWWQARGLRNVEIEEGNWMPHASGFLDFLEGCPQLEKFHFFSTESEEELHAATSQAPLQPRNAIVLPNMTFFLLKSIPGLHMESIANYVSFPPDLSISLGIIDRFPVAASANDSVALTLRQLILRRSSSALTLFLDHEDVVIRSERQNWRLTFINNLPNWDPPEQAYLEFFRQLPTEISALNLSVADGGIQEGHARWLVDGLAGSGITLTNISLICRLDDEWLAALWRDDQQNDCSTFQLPGLKSLTFHVKSSSTPGHIATLKDHVSLRSAALDLLSFLSPDAKGEPTHKMQVTLVMRFPEENNLLRAALDDPTLRDLGVNVKTE
ncbi:hypothetical protein FRB90_005970 [Tulasnella sp. 427]|nr:hypothetical protein FRB90_005970 [Tulasnella sp. 427]